MSRLRLKNFALNLHVLGARDVKRGRFFCKFRDLGSVWFVFIVCWGVGTTEHEKKLVLEIQKL